MLRTTHDAGRPDGGHESGFRGGRTSTDNVEGGVHFYRWREHAMGFSADPSLFLYYADSGIKRGFEEARPADRLSWNLETVSSGGWRAGEYIDLGDSGEWMKCLYYRM